MEHLKPLRDYHEELRLLVDSADPSFKAEHTSIWLENLPFAQTNNKDSTEAADAKISTLEADTTKLQFEADCLALARDAAQLARLFGEESKSERAARVAKVCHLRQENQIGSSLASQHMAKQCKHRAGPMTEIQDDLNKVHPFKKRLKVSILWLLVNVWVLLHRGAET